MRFDVITLFPELLDPFLKQGVTRRAFTDDKDGFFIKRYSFLNRTPAVFR